MYPLHRGRDPGLQRLISARYRHLYGLAGHLAAPPAFKGVRALEAIREQQRQAQLAGAAPPDISAQLDEIQDLLKHVHVHEHRIAAQQRNNTAQLAETHSLLRHVHVHEHRIAAQQRNDSAQLEETQALLSHVHDHTHRIQGRLPPPPPPEDAQAGQDGEAAEAGDVAAAGVLAVYGGDLTDAMRALLRVHG